MAEHEPAGDVLRHLVDGRGRVDVLRSQRLDERPDRERVGVVVRVRVADVHRHGVGAVLAHEGGQAPVDLGERLVPAHLDMRAVAAHEGAAETVGILVERAEGRALRADEPLRERIVRIAADARDVAVLHLELQPTRRLAEWARPECHPRHIATIQPARPISRESGRGDPLAERLADDGPLVVDDAVPGGVAVLAAAHEHVLAMDALERGRKARERRAGRAR